MFLFDSSARYACSSDIYEALRPLSEKYEEHFVVVAMSNANKFLDHKIVSIGSVNSCEVTPVPVFRLAIITKGCARIVIAHNHPSGDPRPSPHDVALTRRLVEVGEIMGIPVLDHLIIGNNTYSSLRDLGMMGQPRKGE